MDQVIYLNILYDYYKDLFTPKQQEYFEDYYHNNLSLGEIAENNNVSRNAVHNQLKIIESKLDEYEEKLKLFEKRNKIVDILTNKIDNNIMEDIKRIL